MTTTFRTTSKISSAGAGARACLAALAAFAVGCGGSGEAASGGSRDAANPVTEFPLAYPKQASLPKDKQGQTHELTYNKNGTPVFWITGHEYDAVVEITLEGVPTYHPLPDGTMPHGLDFDKNGNLWVGFEGSGQIARLGKDGQIAQTFDLPSDCTGCTAPVKQDPHGLGFALDGSTVWYTGKTANTLGKITSDGHIFSWAVPTASSLPIYIRLGPDGKMWFTELTGNKVGRIADEGMIEEFPIPTANSRPIAIVPSPKRDAMWFSEEAGNKVARVALDGMITEFPVPKPQDNMILAGLAFDSDDNLWVQQYVNAANPIPDGPDYVIKIDKKVLNAAPSELTSNDFTSFKAPSHGTVMHRIIEGPDKNMWFTELKTDTIGKVTREK